VILLWMDQRLSGYEYHEWKALDDFYIYGLEKTMIIKKLADTPFADMTGYDSITKQIVIGPDDGSGEIVLRYFKLAPGGSSPHHYHDFPHLVRVETGVGIVIDPEGEEHPLAPGDYVYIHDNQPHCFKNRGNESFEFICVVPGRGEG